MRQTCKESYKAKRSVDDTLLVSYRLCSYNGALQPQQRLQLLPGWLWLISAVQALPRLLTQHQCSQDGSLLRTQRCRTPEPSVNASSMGRLGGMGSPAQQTATK